MRTNTILLITALTILTLAATGCPCPTPTGTNVELTPFSGRFGYGLAGPHDFVGALTKEALTDANWILDGEFTFPTAGYIVAEPDVRIAESYPEQVHITIKVTSPPSGSLVAQVITKIPINIQIPASNEATFQIEVVDISCAILNNQSGPCPQPRRDPGLGVRGVDHDQVVWECLPFGVSGADLA